MALVPKNQLYNYYASIGKVTGPVDPSSGFSQYKPPTTSILGASTGPTRGGNMPSSIPTGSGPTPQQTIQSNQDNGNAQIEADYNAAINMLSGAESGLRGQADTANQTIDQQAGSARNEITNTQGVAEQGANTSLQTAEKQGTSAMQQARDVFRQTQQQNNAQLSALGISSSSVAEALAERLGVDVARRIAGVTGSIQEVRQNTVNELGRIKTYYQGKIQDLQGQVQVQKSQIQNSLLQGLNQINSARGEAANAKSQARANLLSQVQTQLGSLATQQQQFEQSLKLWAEQKTAALTPLTTNEGLQQMFTNFSNYAAQNPQFRGLNLTPSVSMDKYGNVTGSITTSKPSTSKVAFTDSSTGQKYDADGNPIP